MIDLTLITVTYNADRFIDRTLKSVEAAFREKPGDFQVEYLVIDGGSADTTRQRVEHYPQLGIRWRSEPDDGLYDAMNKGLEEAAGRYVWFLNAGDEMYDPAVLKRLAEAFHNRCDVYFSDAMLVREDGTEIGLRSEKTPHSLPALINWRDMKLGMKVCHQAFIVNREIAPRYDMHNLSADLDWEIVSLKRSASNYRIPVPLCRYLVGGLSVQNHRRSLLDRWKVLKRHFGMTGALWNHVRIMARGALFLLCRGKYW